MMTSHNQFRKLKYLVLKDCETPDCVDKTTSPDRWCVRCHLAKEEEE